MKLIVILSVAFAGLAHCYPSRIVLQPNRQAYIFGGYNSNPLFGRSYDYVPQGSMSAVVTRDTVASNSFTGPNHIPLGQLPLEETELSEQVTERNYPPLDVQQTEVGHPNYQNVPSQGNDGFLDESGGSFAEGPTQASVPTVTKSPKKKVNRKGKKQQPQPQKDDAEEEEDEEEEDTAAGAWPFGGSRGVPSYNAFFPITISGSSPSGRRSRPGTGGGNEDYVPSGSATAIANAFSTGKGGIASSHATSVGDPYLASMFMRNGMFNFRNKKPEQEA